MKIRSTYSSWQEGFRQLASVINANKTGSLTLGASTASTVISDSRVGSGSTVILTPTTMNASLESYYVVSGDSEFTVHHSNMVTTDRTFNYLVAE